ncbi:hypothetical protein JYU34_011756, partial [Plutella xylostella]
RHSAVDVTSNGSDKRWPIEENNRLSAPTGDRSNLLRSHAAKSAECSHGSPRPRRLPRESRRVSLAQAPGYVQLNQYRLLEPIGQGSYGIVKLAYNEEDDTHYAMKILSKRKLMRRCGLFGRAPPPRAGVTPSPPPDPLQRVYREIAVLKKLDHPNVVKLVEVLDDPAEDQLYLVFQLLEGGPVVEVPSDSPLSEDLARRYFRDALLGVEYLHYQGIAHRDIKPANLLLGEDRVQVADLGAAGDLAGRLSGAVGTPAFRAPEAAASADRYDGEAADMWSLGVTLFSMVTGRVPWHGSSSAELQRRIQTEPLAFPPRPLSPQLKHLFTRLLDKDPVSRITLQEVKEHEWVTRGGLDPLPSEQENCRLVEVTEEDLARVVTSIPNLSTLILIKTMLKKHSFQNPFLRSREGSTARRESQDSGDSRDQDVEEAKERKPRPGLARSGRSLSAPGNYLTDRQQSFDIGLESVQESRDQSQDLTSKDDERTQNSSSCDKKSERDTTCERERNKTCVKLCDRERATADKKCEKDSASGPTRASSAR